MKILGVTGSSGAGKTLITNLFLKFKNTYIINTDDLAKKMAQKDTEYLNEIANFFGQDILLEDGNLNRKKLSQRISQDENARKELNKITKKHLVPKMLDEVKRNSNNKLIILDIPILYENKLEEYCDKVLAVISKKEEQIKRICLRDNITQEQAENRLKIQLSNEFFKQNADYIIENYQKKEEELLEEIIIIYEEIIKGE
ncbi:MAG: dephospho-CoA kinase [Clostridia bacterium]|nr:dephospho-CoA kinase [Clostridia bacterium]